MASLRDHSSIPRSPDLSRSAPLGHLRTTSARPSGSRPSRRSPSCMELVLHTDARTPCVENEALTTSSPGSRLARPSALSPGPDPSPISPPHSAISDQYLSYTPDHNVVPLVEFLNPRPISHPPGLSSIPGHQVSSSSLLESSRLSSLSTRHVAINSPSARPRTSNQVFNNISDLAAHYGIPQFLPVAPRTIPHRTEQEVSSSHQSESLSSSSDFVDLCSNYLTMLSQSPGENGAHGVPVEHPAPAASVQDATDPEVIRSLMDVLNATPELQMSSDLNEFLTSPLIDSPLDDDLLATPAVDSDMHADILTSPFLGGFGENESFGEFPSLFGEFGGTIFDESKPPQPEPPSLHPNFDSMYRLESPITPLIDTPNLSPTDRKVVPLPSTKRKSNVTGTRKNITPESLVPIDAPTQTRNYLTPSATSRKELPATWRRKRLRTSGPGDEVDQLEEDGVAPSLSEQEQIEAKRRQNTLAARRSRKRKLEYQRELEESLEQCQQECEMWKQRARTYEALLRSHHIDCPQFPDS